jgi:hypothetical protein
MALAPSPNIVTNGLVFAYDMNSKRSYKGPPLQNKLSGLSATAGSGTGYVLTASSEIANIPTVGELPVTICNLQNTGASWCCINFINFGNTGSNMSGSTLYTYMILYRVDSGYTNGNFMYRYEYNSSGTYLTEGGVHDTNKRTYLGNGWYYAWNTFTTQPTTTNMTCYGFSYNYSNFTDRYSYAKVAIVQGDYSGMHPSLWPDLGTTRSSTQVITDLTNNNTWTVNNLSYASDGTFSFNGSSSWIESSTSNVFDSQTITMESWNKPTTTSQSGFLFEKGQVNTQYSNFYNSDGTFYFRTIGLSPQDLTFTASTHITAGQWNHVVCTVGGGTKTVYINGIQRYQQTGVTGTMPTGQTNQYVGKYGSGGNEYPFNGSIAVSRVYNRALSPSEVAQNFQAQRSLYGV